VAPTDIRELPVALFVYRRHGGLARTLECLRDAGVTRLYVFSDGPASTEAEGDVARVRRQIEQLDWISPIIVAREENLGLSASIRAGLDAVFASHETAAVIEDDVCVAAEFCDFVTRALEEYRGSDRIAGVTGLRYPFPPRELDERPFDVFLSPRFSSWGWATWRDRWQQFCFDHDVLRARIAEHGRFRPRDAGADMPAMVHNAVVAETLTGSWDVDAAANMLLRDQRVVTPSWNMVENSGLAEGTHYSSPPPWRLCWEPDRRPALERLRFVSAEDSWVPREYLRFFEPSSRARRLYARARAAWQQR
jgi:hypothetical protein